MKWKGFRDIQATIEIDLTKNEEELWNSLDKDARWGVKRAEKEGLIIKEGTENKDLKKFYEIYKETCKFGGIKHQSLEEINAKTPIFFFCYKDDKLIAGSAIIVKDKKKFRLFLNASDHNYLKLQPNNLLYWHMIKWGKNKKYKKCDLGGYQLEARKGSKLYSVNRFKERWGGQIKRRPIYSYNLFYILGRKLIRKSRFFWWLNKKFRGRNK
jgi:lipid II:glycine glycyltransferase (peptidoglycan interpeptide bridge formation enzyme)